MLGRLGDMYGKRRMLLTSLAVLVVGSVVCAMAYSVIGRILQGLAMASSRSPPSYPAGPRTPVRS